MGGGSTIDMASVTAHGERLHIAQLPLPKRQHMPRIKMLPDHSAPVHPEKKKIGAALIETTLA
jgi:hypothetical protein